MKLTLDTNDLKSYITRQLNNFFPDKYEISDAEVGKILENALKRTEFSFSHIPLKYYLENEEVHFNHLNSEQYAMFLWFLSNEAYLKNNINLAEKLFYLNKALNGLDAFYSIKLPDIFMLVHPVGTVIGNAHYENYLVIHQNCTIGASKEGIYPYLKERVTLFANSQIIGNCNIGNNVSLSAGTSVINEDVPNYSIVFGRSKSLIIKREKDCISDYTFKRG